jgi:hypothetical protein
MTSLTCESRCSRRRCSSTGTTEHVDDRTRARRGRPSASVAGARRGRGTARLAFRTGSRWTRTRGTARAPRRRVWARRQAAVAVGSVHCLSAPWAGSALAGTSRAEHTGRPRARQGRPSTGVTGTTAPNRLHPASRVSEPAQCRYAHDAHLPKTRMPQQSRAGTRPESCDERKQPGVAAAHATCTNLLLVGMSNIFGARLNGSAGGTG